MSALGFRTKGSGANVQTDGGTGERRELGLRARQFTPALLACICACFHVSRFLGGKNGLFYSLAHQKFTSAFSCGALGKRLIKGSRA